MLQALSVGRSQVIIKVRPGDAIHLHLHQAVQLTGQHFVDMRQHHKLRFLDHVVELLLFEQHRHVVAGEHVNAQRRLRGVHLRPQGFKPDGELMFSDPHVRSPHIGHDGPAVHGRPLSCTGTGHSIDGQDVDGNVLGQAVVIQGPGQLKALRCPPAVPNQVDPHHRGVLEGHRGHLPCEVHRAVMGVVAGLALDHLQGMVDPLRHAVAFDGVPHLLCQSDASRRRTRKRNLVHSLFAFDVVEQPVQQMHASRRDPVPVPGPVHEDVQHRPGRQDNNVYDAQDHCESPHCQQENAEYHAELLSLLLLLL
mmetsp:Transcript_26725/g.45444  ORF Transcript_26725/g.45444 Transcript_26725/m.45444 type:complete len:308 (+) Transcript_26725:338-1261(+)